MSRWWRPCQHCGESGDDPRQCRNCQEFAPFGTQRNPYDDWRLIFGIAILALLAVIAIVALGAAATWVGGP